MKKKVIMAGAAVIMSAVAVGFNANTNSKMTDLMSANLEALTQDESKICKYNIVRVNEDKNKITCKGEGEQCCIMD